MMKLVLKLGLSCLTAAATAATAAYPERPVSIVVAYPAGSTMDTLARMLAGGLQSTTGGNFIVDNRPGAAGQIGAEFVARAAPDGYTLFISGSSTHSANPALFKKLRYDPVKDFAPITHIVSLTYALVVSATSPAQTMKDFVDQAPQRFPKGVAYGYGSQLAQVAGATVSHMTGMQTVAVPYKGQPPAITDLIGNQIQFMIADIPVLAPQIKAGKLRALATLNDKRSPLLPDVPTLAEQGYPGYDLSGWVGLSAPAHTPDAVVNWLADACAKVLSDPAFRGKLSSMGMEYEPGTPAQFGKLVANQVSIWAKKVKDAGIAPE